MPTPTLPKPSAQQVAAVKRARTVQIRIGRNALKRGDAVKYAEALAEIRGLNNWLDTYTR